MSADALPFAENSPVEADSSGTPSPEISAPRGGAASPSGGRGADGAFSGEAPLLVLYVFSGPHLGAEVELGPGRYLIGSDDSCDLILSGSSLAPRHAALTAEREPSGMPKVTVTPLDGPVRNDGDEVAQAPSASGEVTPHAGAPWYLGLTCLAWNRPGAPQTAPSPCLESRPPSPAGEPAVLASADEGGEDNDVGEGGNPVAGEVTALGDKPVPDERGVELPRPEVPRQTRRAGRIFLMLALLALLGGLSMVAAPSSVSPDQYVDIFEKKLKDSGRTGLTVRRFAQGVEVSGTVRDEAELTSVRDLARDLQFPVYLDVAVKDDMLRAVSTAFRARGFYPSVSLLPGSSAPDGEDPARHAGGASAEAEADGGDVLLVRGYVQDRLMEEGLFASLADDVTGLPAIRRRIVHRGEVATVLEPALAEAGLDFAGVNYLPGTVEVTGPFGAEALGKARQVLDEAERKLDVPLHSVIRVTEALPPASTAAGEELEAALRASVEALAGLNGEGRPTDGGGRTSVAPASGPSGKSARGFAPADPADREGDPLGGLRVTGVTMSPLRFVTTADGQRLFEGAVLPGGFLLEEISTTVLKLRKDNRIVTYRLRGAS